MKICYWESKIRRRCEARVQRASDILRDIVNRCKTYYLIFVSTEFLAILSKNRSYSFIIKFQL